MGFFAEMFTDYTVSVVLSGTALLGLVSGMCGAVVFVRKETLLADAVSHGCLPGVALGFMAAGGKSSPALLAGAFVTAFLAAGFVRLARSVPAIKTDSALAMGVSLSFGVGIVLLTAIQKSGASGQAGLDRFLFGQASAMSLGDLKTILLAGAVIAAGLAVFWKQVSMACFDGEYARAAGFRTRAAGFFINTALVCVTVAGVETVGVVLMCSMLVAPAVAARHLTGGLGAMVVVSAIFGASGGVAGSVASWKIPNVPTGPAIVICLTAAAVCALLLRRRAEAG